VRARSGIKAHTESQAPEPEQAASALPAALDAPTVLGLQRTSGNAAVSRLLQRAPAPPTGLSRDRSQVHIVPGRGATDAMDYVEFTTQRPRTEVVGRTPVEFDGEARESTTSPSRGTCRRPGATTTAPTAS
jgi:hypothetical protein